MWSACKCHLAAGHVRSCTLRTCIKGACSVCVPCAQRMSVSFGRVAVLFSKVLSCSIQARGGSTALPTVRCSARACGAWCLGHKSYILSRRACLWHVKYQAMQAHLLDLSFEQGKCRDIFKYLKLVITSWRHLSTSILARVNIAETVALLSAYCEAFFTAQRLQHSGALRILKNHAYS